MVGLDARMAYGADISGLWPQKFRSGAPGAAKGANANDANERARGVDVILNKRFLFLQGPHGPFFRDLGRALKEQGAGVLKVGFTAADDREWSAAGPYQPYTGVMADFKAWLSDLISERGVTDIALYGDTREHHRIAVALAKELGLTIHCFEEGYLRPYWITYERDGANGYSRLMDLTVAEMARASRIAEIELEEAPPIWGAAWRHAFHGFRHHFDVMFRNRAYPNFKPHRPTTLSRELALYLKRMMVLPLLIPERRWREKRLLNSGLSYHLVLLQLAVDSSMRAHSDYDSVAAYIDDCLDAFAKGARSDHHLVLKSHPFEDGRERLEAHAKITAERLGVSDRVIFLHGGKLGQLLDRARSALTINSTAGQQALWRGLPISVSGAAVYAKPEFTRSQPLAAFFREPTPPDALLYREYRQFLLMTSQLRGGYYSRRGRSTAIEAAIPKMLDPLDPYERVFAAANIALEDRKGNENIAVFPKDLTTAAKVAR